jgi:hypothetical protein
MPPSLKVTKDLDLICFFNNQRFSLNIVAITHQLKMNLLTKSWRISHVIQI